MHQAVIGLGFGDEGKGHVVDYICSRLHDPLVIRYSGGPQAAHQVILEDGREHIFSHFGSGTFRGAATYWSEDCLVNPIAMMNEYDDLRKKNVEPILYVNPKCPIITPYDVFASACTAREREHGTCGVGIFQTIKREKDGYHLLFEDIAHPVAARHKLELIRKRYNSSNKFYTDKVMLAVEEMLETGAVIPMPKPPDYCSQWVFEGSQGLLLDQNTGFFPHVTPSNTGTTNILKYTLSPNVTLVTRSYQTRHGAGPMSEFVPNNIKKNPVEKNFDDGIQGPFRKTLLDLDLAKYAIAKDPYLKENTFNLAINCLDLTENERRLFHAKKIVEFDNEGNFVNEIANTLKAKQLFLSHSPVTEKIKQYNPPGSI